jgi:phage I-like protein
MTDSQATQIPDSTDVVDHVPLVAAILSQSNVPHQVLIAPWGEVRSTAGSFVVDDEGAKATIAAFEKHANDLPVDYEHQTLGGSYSSPTGQAPAAGWIKRLIAISPDTDAAANTDSLSPGLWALVEWTPTAIEQLRSKQYRYLSPVALVRRSDRRLVGLHSVALTNKPAIVGMRPLVASRMAQSPDAMLDLKCALNLDVDADSDIVCIAAVQRLSVLESTQAHREAIDRVERAMSAGKLVATQKEWALSLAERLPAEFDAWETSAPIVMPLGRTSLPQGAIVANTRGIESAARAEWRANRDVLEQLCTEEAFVAQALRERAIN